MHFISGWGREETSNFRHPNALVVSPREETDVTKLRVRAGQWLSILSPGARFLVQFQGRGSDGVCLMHFTLKVVHNNPYKRQL